MEDQRREELEDRLTEVERGKLETQAKPQGWGDRETTGPGEQDKAPGWRGRGGVGGSEDWGKAGVREDEGGAGGK